MHEYSLARSLVHTIDTIATEQGALGVVTAQVRLGDFSSMSTDGLCDYFTRAAKGTRVEGATLKVHSPSHNSDGDNDNSHALSHEVILESVELRLELCASL